MADPASIGDGTTDPYNGEETIAPLPLRDRLMQRCIPCSLIALFVAAAVWAKPLPRLEPMPRQEDERRPRVVMETNHGRIVLELYPDKAPVSVKNFLQYVDDQHYDGMIFHRTIANFMIQGGGFVPGMTEKKTREPIKNEASNGLANERGTIAMARTSNPDSATAQFYINTKDNPFLDAAKANDKVGYAVFGKVVEGMDVVDKIRQTPTGQRGALSDVPIQDVVIRSIRPIDR